MNDKKPGFWEGLTAGMEPKDPEPDSKELGITKEYIEDMELSLEDKVKLAGWLLGESFKSSILSALTDEPPTR